MEHAFKLAGRKASDVASALGGTWLKFNDSPKFSGKSGIGPLSEAYFGRENDNLQQPDILELGIELKSIPLLLGAKGQLLVKEPTSLTMMNYDLILREKWEEAYLRPKIAKILWIPFVHNSDKRDVEFRKPFLWSPPEEDLPILASDYEKSRKLIAKGLAHELSERIATTLSPRRKGSKGSMTKQPNSDELARTRAWAFKTSYTRPLISKFVEKKALPQTKLPSGPTPLEKIESEVLSILRRWEGKTLHEISESQPHVQIHTTEYKSAASTFVRKLIGQPTKRSSEEFEKLGLQVRTVWAKPSDFKTWESTSFEAMVLRNFAEETWGESTLEDHLDRILFIPLWEEERPTPEAGRKVAYQGRRVLGKAFIWEPSESEWSKIGHEWNTYRKCVRNGTVGRINSKGRWESTMPTEAETEIIHMRPHAQNNEHRDLDCQGNSVTTQSFWLNGSFVSQLLQERARDSFTTFTHLHHG